MPKHADGSAGDEFLLASPPRTRSQRRGLDDTMSEPLPTSGNSRVTFDLDRSEDPASSSTRVLEADLSLSEPFEVFVKNSEALKKIERMEKRRYAEQRRALSEAVHTKNQEIQALREDL